MGVPTPPAQSVFRLRVTLHEVVPEVWRRVLVPGSVRLAKLHDVFQVAMGWTNSHLHSFTIDGQLYGMHFDDYPDEEIDEKKMTVLAAVGGQQRFFYEYDFGDSWEHEVVIEEVSRASQGLKHVCLDGQNTCPPEDCGGVPGYAELLEVLADPDHQDHTQVLQWVAFDPATCDLPASTSPCRICAEDPGSQAGLLPSQRTGHSGT